MPSSTPGAEAPRRSNINPATASREELLARLATDPSTGLSQREAERRLLHSRATPLYATATPKASACFARALREPVLWLLLCVALISLFFDRVPLGLVCLLLAGGHAVFCALLCRRTAQIDAAMQAYDAPISRVLRGGRVCRLGADGLVKGDILYLYPGDMVPADCRLLTTHRFSVSERELDATNPTRPSVRLEKDADSLPDASGGFRFSPANMVFAGGIVDGGTAVAVVVATGSETHLGGLLGSVKPSHAERVSVLVKSATRALSLYNLIQIFLILPVVVVGIFTLGDRYGLLDIFLTALALASLSLTEHVTIKAAYLSAFLRREAATDRDAASTADLKTAVEPEKLTTLTDLLLVGTAALHDGLLHPTALHVEKTIYHCDLPEADAAARSVIELLCVYHRGAALPVVTDERHSFAEDLHSLLPALCEWADFDEAATFIKVTGIRPEPDGASGIFPTPSGNRRITVRLLNADEAFAADPPDHDELYRACREAVLTGHRTLFVVTSDSNIPRGQGTIRAMLTYMPHTCRKTAGVIQSMEASGIRVAAFLRRASEENTRLFAECGLTDAVPACRMAPGAPTGEIVQALAEGHRAFEGCSGDDILTAIRELRAAGRTVAVLSADSEDVALLNAADLAITCSPSLYITAEDGLPALDPATMSPVLAGRDGTAGATMATDLCRRRADMLVRRSQATGGGVCSVRRALLAADHVKTTTDRAYLFLLLSQTVRVVITALFLCLGVAPMAAPILLLSGLLVDSLVTIALARIPMAAAPAPRRPITDGLEHPFRIYRRRLLAVAIAAAAPCISVAVVRFLDMDIGADPAYFGLLCLLGLQFVILGRGCGPRMKRNRTAFFISLAVALFYVGALAAALAAGLKLLWALVFPLCAPLLCFILLLALDRPRGGRT